MTEVILTGDLLSVRSLTQIARDPQLQVTCSPQALAGVARAHDHVCEVVAAYADRLSDPAADPPVQDYGITTGFGEFKSIPIPPEDLSRLQLNLLYSHATGVGESPDESLVANYYTADVVRATLVLRLNTFLRGHSGVGPDLVAVIAEMVNAGIIPRVPLRGSVGSSGDLAPLAHLFGVLLGVGSYTLVKTSEEVLRADRTVRSASDELPELLGRSKSALRALIGPKAGLALTNGAAFSAAMLALAVHDAIELVDAADGAVALTLEAICGCSRAFDPAVHQARPHPGQIVSAAHVRALVAGSAQIDRSDSVQDVYSVRCAPQIHGASRQAIEHALQVAEIEINSTTDNPLLFPDHETSWESSFQNRPAAESERRAAFSAGNFHGQPVALAADYLTIALAELANVSERRTQMLLDSHHSRNLPPNLIAMPGLNCGLMIAQYTAASLVSENKVLAHPASVDSIPTSANVEDHVAMANHAARKALQVLANVQVVLAIEYLAATQAVDWRVGMDISPDSAPPARSVPGQLWRETWEAHRRQSLEFSTATRPERSGAIARALGSGTRQLYTAIRDVVAPLVEDRPLDGDIRAVWQMLRAGTMATLVRRFEHMGEQ